MYVGSARYSSKQIMMCMTYTPRDDLQALAYLFAQIIVGRLPWRSMSGETKDERLMRFLHLKMSTSHHVSAKLYIFHLN